MSLVVTDGRLRAWLRLLIFFLAGLGGGVAVIIVLALIRPLSGGPPGRPFDLSRVAPWLLAAYGLAVVAPLAAATVIGRRFLDGKKPLKSLGLELRRAPAGLAGGFAAGVVFLAAAAVIIALAGGARLSLARVTFNDAGAFAGTLVFLLVFAAAEELMLRGYPIKVLAESWSRPAAVVLTAGVFSALHLGNPGANILTFVNVAAAGVILGLLYLKSGSLWLAIGFHWGWNFGEGGLFGFRVSGIGLSRSIISATATGPRWLSGGAFGPEGSAALTATAAALIAFLLVWKGPHSKRTPALSAASVGGSR